MTLFGLIVGRSLGIYDEGCALRGPLSADAPPSVDIDCGFSNYKSVIDNKMEMVNGLIHCSKFRD